MILFIFWAPFRCLVGIGVRARSARTLAALTLLLAVSPASRAQSITPATDRIDAPIGRPVVVPVEVRGFEPPLKARLEDGRYVDAGLYLIVREPEPGAPSWLGASGRWRSIPAEDVHDEAGSWVVVMLIPPDAIGQGVWIDGTRFEFNWLPDPGLLLKEVVERSRSAERPWTRPVDDWRLESDLLMVLVDEARRDPTRRWRSLLLADGLAPPDEPYAPGLEGLTEAEGAFEDPVIEALARQTEARWRVGLANLWQQDAAIAEELKRRLVATVDLGEGRVVPAWATDGVDRLLDDLLDTRYEDNEEKRAALVRNFIDTQPMTAVWVTDIAGRSEGASGAPVATVGAANLSQVATLCWGSTTDDTTPELRALPAGAAVELAVSLPRADDVRFSANIGETAIPLSSRTTPRPLTPPGFHLSPLLHDWRMDAWLAGDARRGSLPTPGREAAVMLTYEEHENGRRLVAIVECAWNGENLEQDAVRLWLGPFGGVRALLRVTPDGNVVDESPGASRDPVAVPVRTEEDRWMAKVPIPRRAVGAGDVLLIGAERIDPDGQRWAHPLRMLPWQPEPGRVGVDLSAWDELD